MFWGDEDLESIVVQGHGPCNPHPGHGTGTGSGTATGTGSGTDTGDDDGGDGGGGDGGGGGSGGGGVGACFGEGQHLEFTSLYPHTRQPILVVETEQR